MVRGFGWRRGDGHAGLEELYRGGDIREVACLAPVRRKFVDVHRSQGSAIAQKAIARLAEPCTAKKTVRGSSPEERLSARRERAAPAFDAPATRARRTDAQPVGKDPARGGHPPCTEPPAAPSATPVGRRFRDRQQRCRTRHARLRPGAQEPALRRIGHWRQGHRHRRHPHRDRQAQRRRSPRLARRYPRSHPRLQDHPRG